MNVIQVLLVIAVLMVLVYFLRSRGTAKSSALFKLFFVAFGVFGIYAVLRPEDLTWIAQQIGVQRGTDLMLYALIVTFAFTTLGTYIRFREAELRYTRLARAIALQNADKPDA